ncbi:MAG: ImmA/IrrE family metallo-endopeptidase [Clostridia bacterium]|nr:ImmA/IrrE family metallo-endopeptidase [Clostridia bacterium]
MYNDLYSAQEIAQLALLSCNVREFPVNVTQLCEHYGIAAESGTPHGELVGISFIYKGLPVIFVNEQEPTPRRRFISAHEMGHVMLGHVGAWQYSDDSRGMPHKSQEQEAMIYAAELLMPECVLIALGITDVPEIMRTCGVNYSTAFRTAKSIERRIRRGDPPTNVEKALIRQFLNREEQQTDEQKRRSTRIPA